MTIMQKNSQVLFDIISREEIKISYFMKLLIFIFPYATFIGSYINISGINISNLYSVVLLIFVFKSLLGIRYKFIKWYVGFLFVMIIYATASLIWGKYSAIGDSIILPLITGFVAMAFISALNKNQFQLFLKSISFFTIVVLVMAMIEVFKGKYLFFNNVDFIYRKNLFNLNYPGVFFANPNDLAQYLLVGFPILTFGLFEKYKLKVVPIFIFLVTLIVLFNTESRLSLICTVVIVILYMLFSVSYKGKNTRGTLVLFGLTALFIIILNYFGFNFSQYHIIDNFLKVDSTQGYYTDRSSIYNDVFDLGLNNIIFGSGLGGSYYISQLGTHNMFLFIFADLGSFFAVGFIVVLIMAFVTLYKYKYIQIFEWQLGTVILLLLIIFPFFSCMSSGNEQRKIVWVALGLIFATINNYKIYLNKLKKETKEG